MILTSQTLIPILYQLLSAPGYCCKLLVLIICTVRIIGLQAFCLLLCLPKVRRSFHSQFEIVAINFLVLFEAEQKLVVKNWLRFFAERRCRTLEESSSQDLNGRMDKVSQIGCFQAGSYYVSMQQGFGRLLWS